MVVVIERHIQKVVLGKWKDLDEINKKYDVIEKKNGFPPKKRYQVLIGSPYGSHIVERKWDSLAQMEETHMKLYLDPEYAALNDKLSTIISSSDVEILAIWPPEFK